MQILCLRPNSQVLEAWRVSMIISTLLGSIKDSVIEFSNEISKRVDADVLIVDNNFNVIGETVRYFSQYSEIGMDTMIGQVIVKQEKVVIADKRDFYICQKCKEIDKCQIVGFIGVPIYYEDRVIGAIAMILPKHRISSIFQDIDYSIAFIENMAAVLVGKLKNKNENFEIKNTIKEREAILDTISDAIVLTDNFGIIQYANRKFYSSMNFDQNINGKQLQNILPHKLLEDFFETRNTFNNQKILLDLGNRTFYGCASCKLVRTKGSQYQVMFIFRSTNDLLQDASAAGKGSLVTFQWLKDYLFPSDILEHAKTIAVTNDTLLIHGKNQNLNEMLAKAICNYSNRNLRGLITVYCDNIYRDLFEPYVFDEFGELQKADGGTILLHNVEHLPIYLQKKLMEFIKNRTIRNYGITKVCSDVRLMFSTTQDLLQLVKQGVFLDELYYRIAENLIEIPSFNNNKEGLRNIIKSGFKFYQTKYRKEDIVLSDSAIKLLSTYNWNDNINELEKVLEQIVIRNNGNVTGEDIEHMGLLKTEVEEIVSISDMEKERIKDLLLEGYNKTQISQMLGFSRATLYRKMTEYGL